MAINDDSKREINRKVAEVERALFDHIDAGGRLAIVKAPPGSGKTHLLIRAVVHARRRKLRVAVACQTNAQADAVCQRLADDYSDIPIIRFAGGGTDERPLGRSVAWVTSSHDLPTGACVAVGTTAKWGLVEIHDAFDILFVDEAWQMAWKDFMLCGQVASRFVLIGDPGQIPPVITLDVSRWETSPFPPHLAAPDVILRNPNLGALHLELPASRRLPHDAVDLIRPFYDFPFDAYAGPGERAILTPRGGRTAEDQALDLLAERSVAGVTVPTPSGGPPLEQDKELAGLVAQLTQRTLARGAQLQMNGQRRTITAADIGIAATHRAMNGAIELALPSKLRGAVKVDTAERWQGLQRGFMIVVHPLSGVVSPSAFDLETGRLCVMASRHLCGLIVVSRDHLGNTLDVFIPSAAQAIGRPDVTGRGHAQHLGLWKRLEDEGRVVAA